MNADDARYDDLRSIDPEHVISYGMQDAADIRPIHYQFGCGWHSRDVQAALGEIEIDTSLMGKPNLYNIGAAIGVAVALGISADAMIRGIQQSRECSGPL